MFFRRTEAYEATKTRVGGRARRRPRQSSEKCLKKYLVGSEMNVDDLERLSLASWIHVSAVCALNAAEATQRISAFIGMKDSLPFGVLPRCSPESEYDSSGEGAHSQPEAKVSQLDAILVEERREINAESHSHLQGTLSFTP